jgi:hypothetical protein
MMKACRARSAELYAQAAAVLGVSAPDLEAELDALPRNGVDPWSICNGHDVVCILAIALKGPLGAKKKFPQESAVGMALRLAVDTAHLGGLRMWTDLQAWDRSNAPLRACAI